ncbi:MAG: proton-conducting transporter membrane subunit [Planctomycetaceae bacterium]
MTWTIHLPQQIVLLALVIALVGGTLIRAPRAWAGVALGALLAAAGALAAGLARGDIPPTERFPAALVCLAIVVGLPHVLAAFEWQRRGDVSAEYFGLSLTGVFGLMLAATANDLVLLALACELVAVPGYLLAYQSARTGRAATAESRAMTASRARHDEDVLLKLLLPGVLSSLLSWFGFALLSVSAGTTEIAGIAAALANAARASGESASAAGGSPLVLLAMGTIFVAAALRMAAVPFHFGLADVFDRIGFAEGGWLSAAPRLVGWIVLAKVALAALPGHETACLTLAGVLAAATLVGAGVLALAQTRLRPLLGYAAMGQGGLALAGLAAAFAEARLAPPGVPLRSAILGGFHTSLFHLAGFLLMAGGLAAILCYFDRARRPVEHVEDLAGWARDEPLAGTCGAVLLIGLAGLPLLPGFWARLFLASSLLSVEPEWLGDWSGAFQPGLLVLAGALLVGCALLAAAYLRVAAALIVERPLARPRPAGGRPALAAGILATLLAVGIGLMPGPLLEWIVAAKPQSTSTFDAKTSRPQRNAK